MLIFRYKQFGLFLGQGFVRVHVCDSDRPDSRRCGLKVMLTACMRGLPVGLQFSFESDMPRLRQKDLGGLLYPNAGFLLKPLCCGDKD